MPDTAEYNPLDYENLTRNLVRELMLREPSEFPPVKRFSGAGVYALFYRGGFPAYQHAYIRSADDSLPVYVGKAVPKGARKGASSGGRSTGNELYNRLRQHARSIEESTNLRRRGLHVSFPRSHSAVDHNG